MSSAVGDAPLPARTWLRRGLRVLAVVLAGFGLLLGIEVLILHLTTDPLADVHAYYDAGARLNAGLPLYEQTADPNFNYYYFYPPLLAIVFRPLALLPFTTAALIWEAVLLVATVLTFRRIGLREPVVLVACILALPILWALAIGQAQALVTLLLTYGNPFAVALAANIKVFPGLVAVYWVGRREWRRLGTVRGLDGGSHRVPVRARAGGDARLHRLPAVRPGGQRPEPLALRDLAASLAGLGRGDGRRSPSILARTRWGWPAAIVLSVFATPRLLSYQLSTLLAAFRPTEPPADGASGASRTLTP